MTVDRIAAATLLASFTGPKSPAWVLRRIEAGLGGVCLFTDNATADAAPTAAAVLHDAGPVVVAIDEEGGDVTRLHAATGCPAPGPAALGAVDDVALTEAIHHALAIELAAVGIDLDLAPVADVNSDPTNPVIGVRSFGSDAAAAARHVAAAVRGLQSGGVTACAKHFPGHGATRTDSHRELPVLDVTLDVLRGRDLVPFRAAIEAGVAAVMTGHLVVPAIDDVPVTYSAAAIARLLRGELAFAGAVITDALDMGGAGGADDIPARVVRALAAGADFCCIGSGATDELVGACVAAIVAAVAAGVLDEANLATSGERVRALRRRNVTGNRAFDPAGSSTLAALGAAAATRALRVVGELPATLPGAHVVELAAPANIAVGAVTWGIGVHLAALDPGVTVERVGLGRAPAPPPADRPLVVVTRDAHRHADQRAALDHLLAARPDAIVVELGWPDPSPAAAAAARVVTHGASAASGAAVARLLVHGAARLEQEAHIR